MVMKSFCVFSLSGLYTDKTQNTDKNSSTPISTNDLLQVRINVIDNTSLHHAQN